MLCAGAGLIMEATQQPVVASYPPVFPAAPVVDTTPQYPPADISAAAAYPEPVFDSSSAPAQPSAANPAVLPPTVSSPVASFPDASVTTQNGAVPVVMAAPAPNTQQPAEVPTALPAAPAPPEGYPGVLEGKAAAQVAPPGYPNGTAAAPNGVAVDTSKPYEEGADEGGTRGTRGIGSRFKRFLGRELMRMMCGGSSGRRRKRYNNYGGGWGGNYGGGYGNYGGGWGGGYGGHGHGCGAAYYMLLAMTPYPNMHAAHCVRSIDALPLPLCKRCDVLEKKLSVDPQVRTYRHACFYL